MFPGHSVSLLPGFGHADRNTATLFNSLDLSMPVRRLQLRAVQLYGECGETMRPAKSTRLEGLLFLLDMPRDVKGVALAVAETVDDRTTQAALQGDGLPEGLRLAPVAL